MATQTRGTWPELYDAVEKTVHGVMFQTLKELPAKWRDIYNIKTSSRKFERVHTILPFGDVPEKVEGAVYTTDMLQPGYTKDFTHVEFGLGFQHTETAREDDQENQLVQGAKWLSFAARVVQEKRAARPFNNGFTTETTPDGVSFFNTAHVLKGGTTRRNRLSTDADLSVNSLTTALIDLQTETRDEADHLAMPVDALTLLVPPALEFLASKMLESQGEQGTADNDLNTIRTRRRWRLIVNPYLTDANAWFLGATDKNRHALDTYIRVPLRVLPVTTDPQTGNMLIKLRFRQSWGPWAWQNWFATSGS
jgi:hypothetical protein